MTGGGGLRACVDDDPTVHPARGQLDCAVAGLLARGSMRPIRLPSALGTSDVMERSLPAYSCGGSAGISPASLFTPDIVHLENLGSTHGIRRRASRVNQTPPVPVIPRTPPSNGLWIATQSRANDARRNAKRPASLRTGRSTKGSLAVGQRPAIRLPPARTY